MLRGERSVNKELLRLVCTRSDEDGCVRVLVSGGGSYALLDFNDPHRGHVEKWSGTMQVLTLGS